jgi:hypothetical protein
VAKGAGIRAKNIGTTVSKRAIARCAKSGVPFARSNNPWLTAIKHKYHFTKRRLIKKEENKKIDKKIFKERKK